MALANLAALNAQLYGGSQRLGYAKSTSNIVVAAGGPAYTSHWVAGNGAANATGAVPTTAAICDNTTPGGLGALGWQNKIGTEQRIWLDRFDVAYLASLGACTLLLVDRLAHNGGLSGTVTTAQSNGAWPALTRSTNGIGVWAAAEIYTAIGATGTTFTLSYTNDAGGASTSPVTDIGASGRNAQLRLIPINMAAGDKGIKAVTSATLLATTGTAGNFGITLFKTYGMWMCNNSGIPISHSGKPFPCFGPMPAPPDNACLQFLAITAQNSTVVSSALIRGFED